MSVYSGFATRQLENQYNKLLVSLIKIMQRRIVKFYKNEKADESAFKSVVEQTVLKMNQMEHQKYNEPYVSVVMTEICDLLKIQQSCANGCGCHCHDNQKTTFITSDFKQQSFSWNQTISSRKTSTQMGSNVTQNIDKKIENLQAIKPLPQNNYVAYRFNRVSKSNDTSFENNSSNFYKPKAVRQILGRTINSSRGTRPNPNESLEERHIDNRKKLR